MLDGKASLAFSALEREFSRRKKKKKTPLFLFLL
jgi:hypothetical protein